MAILAGVVARVRRWDNGFSLNSDELWIAVNLDRRSFRGLLGSLEYDQLAPVGWLWLHKLVLGIGRSDAVLRLPGLVAGCAVLVCTALLARRLLAAPFAVAAVALVAGAPILIYQASQLKQYSFEAAACVLLVLLAVRALDADGRWRAVAAFWFTGAVAVWFATTAVFVLAAVGGGMVLFATLDRQWVLVRRHLLTAAPAVACAGAVYLLAPPPAAWLYEWWSQNYPASLAPHPLGVRSGVLWTARLADRFVISALTVEGRLFSVVVVLSMVAGAVALAVRMPRRAVLVCAPLLAGYLLAMLRLYPLASRVSLWLVPLALLLACAAADGAVRAVGVLLARRSRDADADGRSPVARAAVAAPAVPAVAAVPGVAAVPAVAAVTAAVLVAACLPWWGAVPARQNADRFASAQDAVRYVAVNRRPGDRVFAHNSKSTSAMVIWYGPSVGLNPDGQYGTVPAAQCTTGSVVDLSGAGQVWLLRVNWTSPEQALAFRERAAMARYGTLVEQRWFGGVIVLRYAAAPPTEPPATAPCLVGFPVPL